MITNHVVLHTTSAHMPAVQDASVALVVTSPPYPMIEMWDSCFCTQDQEIEKALREGAAALAFERMHRLLDQVWREVDRVLIPGGLVCINIGDATRTLNGVFQLFSNHNRILSAFCGMGYCVLPDIIWRKPSNSPNKFMGSGMYPAGAYVTYEHEYILIFRKGGKRIFTADRDRRQRSAYFWEERNIWFSDLWEITGQRQKAADVTSRERSAAFPFEIPYRLVNMYSIQGDTVLDPFAGTGTTLLAAMAAGRSSIGVEIDSTFAQFAVSALQKEPQLLNCHTEARLQGHRDFMAALTAEQAAKCYQSEQYPFRVKTKQEIRAYFPTIAASRAVPGGVECRCQ